MRNQMDLAAAGAEVTETSIGLLHAGLWNAVQIKKIWNIVLNVMNFRVIVFKNGQQRTQDIL